MKRIFLMLIFCFSAGLVLATKPVYLPTKAYQGGGIKEFVYDDYGHITLAKSELDSAVYAYHRLPNGKFVFTERDEGYWRETAAYDTKGMQLWEQYEGKDYGAIGDDFQLMDRTEAIVDAQGIRTGIRVYNEVTKQMEVYEGCVFDTQGRTLELIEYGDEMELPSESSKSSSVFRQGKGVKSAFSPMFLRAANLSAVDSFFYVCTWGADNRPNSYSMVFYDSGTGIKDTVVFYNIKTVRNGEYHNQYDLFPLLGNYDEDISFFANTPQQYNWNDYHLRTWFFDADIMYSGQQASGQQGKWTTTVNANTITQKVSVGNIVSETATIQLLENGGWSSTTTTASEEGITYYTEEIKQYNTYGALVRAYYKEERNDAEYGYNYTESENTYIREYDAQDRPIKTIIGGFRKYKYGEEGELQESIYENVEETYDSWQLVNVEDVTGVTKTVGASTVLFYPNPVADGKLTIENGASVSNAAIYNLQGSIVSSFSLQQGVNKVDVSYLSIGVYVMKVGNWRGKLVVK